MWKVLIFLACVASFDVGSCNHEQCGTNERYVVCPDTMCLPQNCSQRGLPVPCPVLGSEGRCPGKPACICIDNYLRDDTTGECIPSKKCKLPATTAAPTTEPTEPPSCDGGEPTVTTAAPTTEPTEPPSCGGGGHPPKCGKNEVYNNCSDVNNCGPYRCSELGYPLNCDKKCKPGCICKDDYVRDDKGVCIPIKNCPSCGGDKNAESGCGNNCGKTCSSYNPKPVFCSYACVRNGCDCRDGYAYDPHVKSCVRPLDCTPTCKVNEEYSSCINGGCDPRNCSQVGQPKICIDPVTCIKGCVCVKGYLRASNGTCVPTDQCPQPPPRCGKNEMYNNCSDNNCGPLRCSELGYPLNCDKKCKPGCICKDNYVRDDNGVCIPIKNCPSCGGDKNAESGCGNNCGKTCATYKMKPAICTLACKLNGCDCRDGYVYDTNVKSCVRPQDCTPTCKVNEEYSSCINGGCDPRNCSQVGQPKICIDPLTCIKGCVCVKGYLRALNGTCVPTDQCPPPPTTTATATPITKTTEKPTPDCPPDEVWSTCPKVKCDADYCAKTRDSPQTCPVGIVCDKPRCVCGYNKKRDRKTGKCISIPDCPPFKCDCNEEYQACPSNCPGEMCSDYMKKPNCPLYVIGITANCRPACKCIKGYYRNADGKCVPACECAADSPVEKL